MYCELFLQIIWFIKNKYLICKKSIHSFNRSDERLTLETPAFLLFHDGGQFTFSTQLLPAILSHRRNTKVSLETYLLYIFMHQLYVYRDMKHLNNLELIQEARLLFSATPWTTLKHVLYPPNFVYVSYLVRDEAWDGCRTSGRNAM